MPRSSKRVPEQGSLAIDTAPRHAASIEPYDLRHRVVGSFCGERDGKSLFIVACDRCHLPGVCVNGRYYHEMPFPKKSCSLENAPRPNHETLVRLRGWYKWAQGEMRRRAVGERERLEVLDEIVHPMRSHLLDKLVTVDRRNLPTVTECMLIQKAMERTEDQSFIEPIRLEEWSPRNSS